MLELPSAANYIPAMKKCAGLFVLAAIQLWLVATAAAQSTGVTQTALSNVQTQIVTLTAQINSTKSYNFSTNQIVSVSSVGGGATPLMTVAFNNITTPVALSGSTTYPVTFTGATNVSIVSVSGSWFITLTVLTPSTNAVPVVPVNSVVIPSDAKGPVQIILESSSDLVNWTASLPGTYGNTYSNRFFRVRAVAQ